MSVSRPEPRLNSVNRFFWTSGADGVLRLQQCDDCGQFLHPPQVICRKCLGENLSPTDMAGTGVVDSYTINYQQWNPSMPPPYVIARVKLDGTDGVILTTNIVNCDVTDVAIGDKVKVLFEQQDEIYFPLFEKVR